MNARETLDAARALWDKQNDQLSFEDSPPVSAQAPKSPGATTATGGEHTPCERTTGSPYPPKDGSAVPAESSLLQREPSLTSLNQKGVSAYSCPAVARSPQKGV